MGERDTVEDRPQGAAATISDAPAPQAAPETAPPPVPPMTSGDAPLWPGGPDDPVTYEQPGRYRVQREFGRGGQAVVYLAFDSHIGREVALKMLLPQHERTGRAALRFLREARVTGQLEHPGIVPVHELGQRADGSRYYTQKLVRGRTLRDAIDACKSLPERLKLLPHFADVCQALAYAHGRGVVHRDLKPENVMVGEFGETVVLDWGLAKVRGASDSSADTPFTAKAGQTVDGTVIGTPLYMSPEQAFGKLQEVDEKSDTWGLGAILYEILAGRPPFLGLTADEVIYKVANLPVPRVAEFCPSAPPDLVAVAERAVTRDRDKRYASARELAAEVEAWMSGARVRAYEYTSWELVRRFAARNQLLSSVIGASVVLLAAFAVLIAREHRASLAHLADARLNLAEALLGQARSAEKELQWPRAAAFYAAARGQVESGEARWGQAIAQRIGPLPVLRRDLPGEEVWGLVALPGGQVATASDDGGIRLWDSRGALLALLGSHQGQAPGIAASADGARVASAGIDGTVRVFDVAARRQVRELRGHTDEVWAVAFSRDGKLLASGALDGTARIWDASSGAHLATLTGHEERVAGLSFAPDGRLATASFDGAVRLWSPAWKELSRLTIPGAQLWAVAFSPSGRVLAAGGSEGALRLWAPGQAREITRLEGHERAVAAVAFSPDGRALASAGLDGNVRLWDARTGRGRARVDGHDRPATAVAFALDGSMLFTGGEDATLRGFALPAEPALHTLMGHGADVRAVAFSPDGRTLASGSEDGAVHLWPLPAPGEPRRFDTGGWVRSVAFSSDGKLLAAGSDDQRVHVWELASGAHLELPGHSDEILAVAFAPGTSILASTGNDGTVRVWDVARRAPAWAARTLRTTDARQAKVRTLAWSPDGRTLATGGTDSTVRLWDGGTGDLAAVLRGHEGRVRNVAFSPDGRLLASGANDRDVLVWELPSGKLVRKLEGHEGQVRGLVFTPDGRALVSASADRTVRIWDPRTGEPLWRALRHDREILGVALSPDGRTLATASRDKSVEMIRIDGAAAVAPPEEALRKILSDYRLKLVRLRLEDVN